MDFEFDDRKAGKNAGKHGVTFAEAALVFEDPDMLRVPGRSRGERRFLAIGMCLGKVVSVVYTMRGENIRIISARLATERGGLTMEDKMMEAFEAGEDMDGFFDFDAADRPNRETRRVNVDFPVWMLNGLDDAADRLAINRQAVIKTWIADRLKQESRELLSA